MSATRSQDRQRIGRANRRDTAGICGAPSAQKVQPNYWASPPGENAVLSDWKADGALEPGGLSFQPFQAVGKALGWGQS